MKILAFVICWELVCSASIRSQGGGVEETAAPAADIGEVDHGHGHGGSAHTHEDHHRDEPRLAKAEEAKVVFNQSTDGTGKYSGLAKPPRLDRAYDAIHNRERRSPTDQIPVEQVSLNCREVVAIGVRDPYTCAKLGQGQLAGDASTYGVAIDAMGQIVGADGKVILADPTGYFSTGSSLDLSKAPGRCRYDANKAQVNPSTACLCLATSATCTQNRDGCYWFVDKKSGNKECISNAERFYDLLYMLLQKRGKKDFAINIRYGGTPARGSLPMGPMGPMIIGQGNPSPTYAMNADGTASPASPSTVLPFSYGTPLDGLPPNAALPTNPYGGLPGNPMGFSAQPYGMMPQQPALRGLMEPTSYGGLGYPLMGTTSPGYGMPMMSSY